MKKLWQPQEFPTSATLRIFCKDFPFISLGISSIPNRLISLTSTLKCVPGQVMQLK